MLNKSSNIEKIQFISPAKHQHHLCEQVKKCFFSLACSGPFRYGAKTNPRQFFFVASWGLTTVDASLPIATRTCSGDHLLIHDQGQAQWGRGCGCGCGRQQGNERLFAIKFPSAHSNRHRNYSNRSLGTTRSALTA